MHRLIGPARLRREAVTRVHRPLLTACSIATSQGERHAAVCQHQCTHHGRQPRDRRGGARRLAAEGASVTITYRTNAERAQSLVAELTDAGNAAFAFQGDVRDRAATQALTRRATEAMGGLDVLISNAGVEFFGPLDSITEEDFRRVFDTNVAGELFAVQAAVPHMTVAAGSCSCPR